MKKVISSLLVIAIIIITEVSWAEGLLPVLTTLFGVDMPSLSAVVLRFADEEHINSDGNRVVIFHGVTDVEIDEFSEYLDTFGCELVDYSVTGSVLKAEIAKQGATFSFKYDTAIGDCILIYPKGTNEENVKQIVIEGIKEKWKVGNTVTFGIYSQTKTGTDKTPIEWIVLAREGDNALLISKYALDTKPYNETEIDVTWEKCTLRKWLNSDFYNTAFSAKEKQYIVESNVSADRNPSYSTNPGKATKDYVYILSIKEAEKYFANDSARMCATTDYAIENGAHTSNDVKTADGRGTGCWWLRSPGFLSTIAAVVNYDSDVNRSGKFVNVKGFSVRPCIRVRIF